MSVARLTLVAVLAGMAASCGSEVPTGDDAGGDDSPDGGSGGDADGCYIDITYDTGEPVEGQTVKMTAFVPSGDGFYTYHWTVNGSPDGLSRATEDESAQNYTFAEPGNYDIGLEVDGSPCVRADEILSVRSLDAMETNWRLRFTLPPGANAPPQEKILPVYNGDAWDLNDISLTPGSEITGTIVDGTNTPVAAYLRLTPVGSPDLAIDGFAGATGGFAVDVTPGWHDLLIIPFRTDLAPRLIPNWVPQSGNQTVDAGIEVTGTVVDPASAGVVGATVTLRVAGVPSSVGTTGAGGAFSVRARAASNGVVEVEVVPPAGSGLPRLSSSPAVLDLGNPLAVSYQGTLVRRDVVGTSVTIGGSAAVSAEVTFTGSIGVAGLVSSGLTQTPAAGSFAIPVTSSGAGVLPSALVPAGPGVVVVEPTTGRPGALAVDLTTAVPATLAAPGAVTVSGRVVGPTGSPVVGASLRAIPIGALAAAGVAEAHVSSDDAGAFALPVVGGGSYQLVVVDRQLDLSWLRRSLVVAGDVGNASLGDVALPEGLRLSGRVTLSGAGTLIGTAVSLYCESCPGGPSSSPDAQAVTDSGGRFSATVLDVGTE